MRLMTDEERLQAKRLTDQNLAAITANPCTLVVCDNLTEGIKFFEYARRQTNLRILWGTALYFMIEFLPEEPPQLPFGSIYVQSRVR